jgi:hypothetical protein
VATSTDGITWTARTLAIAVSSNTKVAYGNSVFVAAQIMQAGATTYNSYISTSTDGITWTYRSTAIVNASEVNNIAYLNNKFWLWGSGGYFSSSSIFTSTDGITWTNRTGAINEDWFGIGYSASTTNKYVMVAPNTTRTQYSTDGISWSAGAMPNSAFWNCVTYGDKWVALSAGPTTTAATSTDAVTWTTRTMPANLNWRKVEYHTNKYVAIAYSSPSQAASSTDGISWTVRSMYRSADWYTLIPRTNG